MIKSGFPKKWVGNSPMFFLISKTPGWRWELGKKCGHAHPDASGGAISILVPLRRKLPRIDNTIHQVAENVWPIVHNQNLTSLEKFEERKRKIQKNPISREIFFQMGLKMLKFCAHQTHRLGRCMGFILFFCIVIWVLYFYFYDVLCDHL